MLRPPVEKPARRAWRALAAARAAREGSRAGSSRCWSCSPRASATAEIADRLVISEATAIRDVANIYGKIGANNRAAAVRIATERGLLAPDLHTEDT